MLISPIFYFYDIAMKTFIYDGEYFNVKDTLECGQIFRFYPYEKGYKVIAMDKCAYAYNDGDKAVVECDEKDSDFFADFFDVQSDYGAIYNAAIKEGNAVLSKAATAGKGIRILNQNAAETLFSFIVSQNNNIPRIKGILERLCAGAGDKKTSSFGEYYSFPSAAAMAEKDLSFYSGIGLGYRAAYIKRLADDMFTGKVPERFECANSNELKNKLLSVYGVGEKVANCVLLFGYKRTESFPVDTWMEKVYREDFKGTLKTRGEISAWCSERFGKNAGYFQQYLFYYKRGEEKSNKTDLK